MSIRKTKKASKKILNVILDKYDLEKHELEELKNLLFVFVQFMTTKAIKETLTDYNIHL